MTETKEIYVTNEGLEQMKQELEDLIQVKRPEVIKALKEARALGDLSENAEYDAARQEQAQTEARIKELEAMIEHAVIIENVDTVHKVGSFGNHGGESVCLKFGLNIMHDHLAGIRYIIFQGNTQFSGSCSHEKQTVHPAVCCGIQREFRWYQRFSHRIHIVGDPGIRTEGFLYCLEYQGFLLIGFLIHETQHEHVFRFGVLYDGRHQSSHLIKV